MLKVEYGTLRAEILQRTLSRFHFLTVPFVVIALMVTLLASSRRPPALLVAFVLASLSILVGFGLWAFIRIGRGVGLISIRVAQLEHQINALMTAAYGTGQLLRWETDHQARSGLSRFYNGAGSPPAA